MSGKPSWARMWAVFFLLCFVLVGSKKALEVCGGRSEVTDWQVLHLSIEDIAVGQPAEPGALFIDINASHCAFPKVPVYIITGEFDLVLRSTDHGGTSFRFQ